MVLLGWQRAGGALVAFAEPVFATHKPHLDAVISEGIPVMPPITIGGIQHRRPIWMGAGRGDEFPVGRIEAGERRVVGELAELARASRILRKVHFRNSIAPVAVIREPLEKDISGAPLSRKGQMPPVLVENETAPIQDK
jgi:hypothetical protein